MNGGTPVIQDLPKSLETLSSATVGVTGYSAARHSWCPADQGDYPKIGLPHKMFQWKSTCVLSVGNQPAGSGCADNGATSGHYTIAFH